MIYHVEEVCFSGKQKARRKAGHFVEYSNDFKRLRRS